MGIPWKKVFGVAATVGKGMGGFLAPGLPAAIELIEEALPAAKGPDKLAAVEAISDAALEAAGLLTGLTAEQSATIKAARREVIDAYVASRNAEAQYRQAVEAFEDVVASFRRADGTGVP